MPNEHPEYINFLTLFVTINNIYVSLCVFFFTYMPSYTLKHHLNFILVTELQHCQKNSITKLYRPVFSFQMFIRGWASSRKRPFNSYVPRSHKWEPFWLVVFYWPAPVMNTFNLAWQGCLLMRTSTVDCGLLLPANHLVVFVNRDVRNVNVIIRTKVTVRGTKPFIKPMLQRQKLWLVPKMPVSII